MKVEPILFDTYLSVIKGSVGSKMFRASYALVDGKRKDILEKGNLSCAFYVSSLLKMFGLAQNIHGTVSSTVSDMEGSGWVRVAKPRTGAVLVWEPKTQSSKVPHRHIGFCISASQAVSNYWKKGAPSKHHMTFGVKSGRPERAIESIWWHPSLEK